jgi:hypothetical protein
LCQVDFVKLHSLLNFRHIQGRLPSIPKFPSQLAYAIEKARAIALPSHELLSREVRRARAMIQRRKAMEQYLKDVLRVCSMRVAHDLYAFLEISSSTIQNDLGMKGKEGYVKKRSGEKHLSGCMSVIYHTWNAKWFVLRDSYIAYFNSLENPEPRYVLILDQNSQVWCYLLIQQNLVGILSPKD